MRLSAASSTVLRQEVRGEEKESESQSSAIAFEKVQRVSALLRPLSISASQVKMLSSP